MQTSETKHALGKFRRIGFAIVNEKGEVVAACFPDKFATTPERRVDNYPSSSTECIANAKLFAAAQDLLFQLELALDDLHSALNAEEPNKGNPDDDPTIVSGRAAIAKATGQDK